MVNVGFVSKGFKDKKVNLKDRNKHEALLARLSRMLAYRKGASKRKTLLFKVLDELRSVMTQSLFYTC